MLTLHFRKFSLCSASLILFILNSACSADRVIRKPTQFILMDYLWRHYEPNKVSNYMDFLESQGYTGVSMEIMDHQKNFYFNSPLLAKMKWIQQPNLLTSFFKEWDEKNKFLGEDALNFSISLTPLAQRRNEEENIFLSLKKKVTDDLKMDNFFIDLQASYRFDSIISEPFKEKFQSLLCKIVAPAKRKLDMLIASHSFEHFLRTANMDKKEVENSFHRIVTSDSRVYPINRDIEEHFPTIGLGDLAFALGRTYKREVWTGVLSGDGPVCDHNLFLYRTAQYAPQGYFLMTDDPNSPIYDSEKFNFDREIKQDVAGFYDISKTKLNKPIANLVIGSYGKQFQEPYFTQFIEPITNAILANGYEIKLTFGNFYKKADLYYVVTMDEKPRDRFIDELLNLMNLKKSRFYGTVILHPMHEIENSGQWKKVRKFFHIPKTEKGWINGLPYSVRIGGKKFVWKGTVSGKNYGMSFIRESAVRSDDGEVFLYEVFQNNTLALIMKSGNHYLINGNFLHIETSYFLSQLMGNALQSPFSGYVTAGRSRTAALAIADTTLKIKIPSPESPDQWHCIIFDEKGRLIQNSSVKSQETFEHPLKANHLLILKTH